MLEYMVGLVILVVLVCCAFAGMAIFAAQNSAPVAMTFVTVHAHTAQWYPVVAAGVAVLVAVGVYALVAGAGWRLRHGRLQRQSREHEARAARFERENLELREELAGRRARSREAAAPEPPPESSPPPR